MKLFEVKTDLTSFTYPAVKITICLLVILFSIARNRIFHISSAWVNAVVTILCFVLTVISILCLYISIGELFHVASNRKNTNYHPVNIKKMTIEAVTDSQLILFPPGKRIGKSGSRKSSHFSLWASPLSQS